MSEWQTHSDATLERFETTGNQQTPLKFAGMHITEYDNIDHRDQDLCMSMIEQITSNAEFSRFASMRMKPAWQANTRPGILSAISQISQIPRVMYEKNISKHFKLLSKLIKYVQKHKTFIRTPKLDCNSLRITAYSDTTFANTADLSPRPGIIVLLTDDNHNAIPVSYPSYKSRCVVCSVLTSEMIVFTDLFDDALAIRK